MAFFNETRNSQEKRSISLPACEDYVDMSLKKVSCDKSLAAVLLMAKEESVEEEESHYEPIYISADHNLPTSPDPDQESDIYEYCDF